MLLFIYFRLNIVGPYGVVLSRFLKEIQFLS